MKLWFLETPLVKRKQGPSSWDSVFTPTDISQWLEDRDWTSCWHLDSISVSQTLQWESPWGKFRDFCKAQLRKSVFSWISANSQSCSCVRKLTLPSELVWWEETGTWSRPSLYFDKLMNLSEFSHLSAPYGHPREGGHRQWIHAF